MTTPLKLRRPTFQRLPVVDVEPLLSGLLLLPHAEAATPIAMTTPMTANLRMTTSVAAGSRP